MVVLGYPDIAAAGDAVPPILPHQPWQLEGLDQVLLQLEQQAQLAGEAMQQLPARRRLADGRSSPATTRTTPTPRRKRLLDDARRSHEHAPHVTASSTTRPRRTKLIEVREAGLGATAHPIGQHETWEGWEDSAVPPDRLGDYLRDLRCAAGRLRLRQDRDLPVRALRAGLRAHPHPVRAAHRATASPTSAPSSRRAADLVVSYGGSLSGEHGDGQSRGELLPKMFGAAGGGPVRARSRRSSTPATG